MLPAVSLASTLSVFAPGGYCPETDLFNGISSHPQPLPGDAKQSLLAGKSPTSLLGCKLWGLGWSGVVDYVGPKVVIRWPQTIGRTLVGEFTF